MRNNYAPALLLPPGENYTGYRWPVHGREIFVLQLGEFDQEKKFARHLLVEGAAVVRVLTGDHRLNAYRGK